MAALLDASADELDLKLTEGDPISFAFTVADVDWSGTYLSQIRASPDAASPLVTLTVTATYSAPDTAFTLTATAAANVLTAPGAVWDMQLVGGATRLRGRVFVVPQVSR